MIYLDMDAVMVDLIGPLLAHFGRPHAREQITYWDAPFDTLGFNNAQECWDTLDREEGSDFWAELPWAPFGQELYQEVRQGPHMIVSTPASPWSALGKMLWLERFAPGSPFSLASSKHEIAGPGKGLIDDADHNVEGFREHGGTAFLWPQRWNEHKRPPNRSDFAEVVDFVRTRRRW